MFSIGESMNSIIEQASLKTCASHRKRWTEECPCSVMRVGIHIPLNIQGDMRNM